MSFKNTKIWKILTTGGSLMVRRFLPPRRVVRAGHFYYSRHYYVFNFVFLIFGLHRTYIEALNRSRDNFFENYLTISRSLYLRRLQSPRSTHAVLRFWNSSLFSLFTLQYINWVDSETRYISYRSSSSRQWAFASNAVVTRRTAECPEPWRWRGTEGRCSRASEMLPIQTSPTSASILRFCLCHCWKQTT